MAKHNPIKFDTIWLSKLLNKCENEPLFEKKEHEYISIWQISRTSGGRKSYQKELFQLGTQWLSYLGQRMVIVYYIRSLFWECS